MLQIVLTIYEGTAIKTLDHETSVYSDPVYWVRGVYDKEMPPIKSQVALFSIKLSMVCPGIATLTDKLRSPWGRGIKA